MWSTFGSSHVSMFSFGGQALPFLPYGLRGGHRIHDLYEEGLDAIARYPDAVIPVERINGPVMVVCGKLDSLWPSCRMSAQIVSRLQDNGFRHAVHLLEYADAGHSVFGPPVAAESVDFAALGTLGGSPESNNAARRESWPKAVSFLDAALKSK